MNVSSLSFTCHHQRPNTFHAALHGSFHEGGEAVAVPPLDVQSGVVVEQVVGDGDVTLGSNQTRAATITRRVQTGRCHARLGFVVLKRDFT